LRHPSEHHDSVTARDRQRREPGEGVNDVDEQQIEQDEAREAVQRSLDWQDR
jgi:hypothetical protein